MDCGAKVMIILKNSNTFAEKFREMTKIIGIGNALVDVLTNIEKNDILNELNLPQGGMTLIDDAQFEQMKATLSKRTTSLATGGSAANTIKALAQLGAAPGFIGKIGMDSYGDAFSQGCKTAHIDAHLILTDQQTGVASTFISKNGERTFATYLGAAANLMPEDLTIEMLKAYDYLYVEGYLVFNKPLILHIVKLAKKAGLKICLDMASYNIVESNLELFHILLEEYVDIVFANEEESKSFTGKNPEEALAELSEYCDTAIVKVGARGAYARREDKVAFAPAENVKEVIDTTGAGDYFAAGFLYGFSAGKPLETCLKMGSILSGAIIQHVGATLSNDIWNEINIKITETEKI